MAETYLRLIVALLLLQLGDSNKDWWALVFRLLSALFFLMVIFGMKWR